MDIANEPITLDGELLFCEEGNRLALRFLVESHRAVSFAGIEPSTELLESVNGTLRQLLMHRTACADCDEG